MEINPAFEAARRRVDAAVKEALSAISEMVDIIDSRDSHHDDVAELIISISLLKDAYQEAKPEMDESVLEWLTSNEGGVRSVRVGDMKWYGEKEKSVKCLDVGEAARAAAGELMHELLMTAVCGDVDAYDRVLQAIADLFREIVSTNGLKDGACKRVICDGAEARYRARAAAVQVTLLPGEDVEQAVERIVEAEREGACALYFEETWPDRLKGGDAKVKLGVANLRFVHRRGGGDKKELEALERARLLRDMQESA